MKMLKKLALVSAVSMISAGAFAMEAMDDESMAETTGQDGITVLIKPPVSPWTVTSGTNQFAAGALGANNAGQISIDNIYIHDKGGLTSVGVLGDVGYTGTAATSGAITLTGFKVAGDSPIRLDIDADGGTGGNSAVLNVKVSLPAIFVVRTGSIGVAGSKRAVGAVTTDRGLVAGSNVTILDSMDLSLGGTTMNIQLGHEPQGAMIKVNGAITGGLKIAGLKLNDTAGATDAANAAVGKFGTTGGSIYVDDIVITDNADTSKLTLKTDIDISAGYGLVMTMDTASPKTDILMANVRLGAVDTTSAATIALTKSIGDVEIVGLNMANTQIAIFGH